MDIKAYSENLLSSNYKSSLVSELNKLEKGGDESSKESNGGVIQDTLKLSTEALEAQARASLGIERDKKLVTRSDYESVAKQDKTYVANYMEDLVTKLDISAGTGIKLSLGAGGKIEVAGDFEARESLSKALNEDADFKAAFKRLGINSQVATMGDQFKKRQQNSLMDYMNGTANDEELFSMIRDYQTAKGMNNSMSSMLYYTSKYAEAFSLTFDVK